MATLAHEDIYQRVLAVPPVTNSSSPFWWVSQCGLQLFCHVPIQQGITVTSHFCIIANAAPLAGYLETIMYLQLHWIVELLQAYQIIYIWELMLRLLKKNVIRNWSNLIYLIASFNQNINLNTRCWLPIVNPENCWLKNNIYVLLDSYTNWYQCNI